MIHAPPNRAKHVAALLRAADNLLCSGRLESAGWSAGATAATVAAVEAVRPVVGLALTAAGLGRAAFMMRFTLRAGAPFTAVTTVNRRKNVGDGCAIGTRAFAGVTTMLAPGAILASMRGVRTGCVLAVVAMAWA